MWELSEFNTKVRVIFKGFKFSVICALQILRDMLKAFVPHLCRNIINQCFLVGKGITCQSVAPR